ncbi:MAG: oxygen-independent coproporphyrinogen III oxidase [Reyranella sp.]|uniref:oxygen-independent coproporphyrinogen III oxidase n=1 Tax=Reyranella sp. TaxID=1929291 RepID=UPI003D0B6A6E
MDAATLAAYDKAVPRYTSYPTAAQFDTRVGPAEHAAWLGELGGAFATVYFHVPFCTQLCWYCACNTMAMNRAEPLDAYARAMLLELDRLAGLAPELIVGAIQWGGGTPSQLGTRRLVDVARHLAARFDRRSGAEVSMEIDPRHCTAALVDAMTEIGVTRASLGVQDFDPGVQHAINRLQSAETTADVLDRLRAAGIRRINIDLVYGLPRQTLATLSRTLDAALALEPDRFAVFGYAHVPWMKPRQRLIDQAELPGAELRAEMAALVSERVSGAGYRRIGLDHFARPDDSLARADASGRLRRTFQGYVADESPWVVGIGASAISSLLSGFTQNIAAADRYGAALETGALATARGVALSDSDRLRGEIINRLMCLQAVDLAEVCRRHHVEPVSFLAGIDDLPRLIEDGLVNRQGDLLHITDRGRPLVRSVCAAFDSHFTPGLQRHARAI